MKPANPVRTAGDTSVPRGSGSTANGAKIVQLDDLKAGNQERLISIS